MHADIQLAIAGMAPGALLALLALGLQIEFRSSGVLNFAHGAVATLAAYCCLYFFNHLDMPIGLAAVVSVLVAIGVTGLFQLRIIARMPTAPILAKIVATLGLMLLITSAIPLLFGSGQPPLIPLFGNGFYRLPFGNPNFVIGASRAWFIIVTVVLTVVLWAVYRFTTFGRATRAIADNERAAEILGYRPDQIALVNWLLGGLLAGVAGVLLGTLTPPTATGYTLVLIAAIAIALVAKFQSFTVMLVAGLLVGIGQAILLRYDQNLERVTKLSGWGDALPLLIILAIVLFGGQSIAAKGNRLERPLPDVPVAKSPVTAAVVALVLGVLWYVFAPLYLIDYSTSSIDMGIVALSLVVVVGYTGQISLMQMTVAGFGAWAAAKTAAELSVPFPLTIVIAAIGGAVLAFVVGAPAVRVRGINLAVVTLAVAIVMDDMFFSDPGLAGADAGLPMPSASIFGIQLNGLLNPRNLGIVALVVFVLVGLGVYALRRSALGHRMVAVRANERGAAATGINVFRTKLMAFAIAGAIAGTAGSLEAYRTVQTNWDSFAFFTSITILAFAYLGGVTYIAGGVVAGIVAPGGVLAGILHFQGRTEEILAVLGGLGVMSIVIVHPAGLAPDLQRLYRRLLRAAQRPFVREPATIVPARGSPPMEVGNGDTGKLPEVKPVERLR